MNSNNNNINNNNVVHCKLAFNGQNRRFSFYGTEFTQLVEQVSLLIGLPVNGFVLKYVDNESDLITVTTNEEFALALAISEKVLRLKADSVSISAPSSPMVEGCGNGPHHHKMHHQQRHHGHGHHGHQGHHGYGHHGHHGHHGHGQFHQTKGDRSSISKCDRKEKKIELLKLFLSQMPPDESLTPAQSLRKAHLRQKIQKIESLRANWSGQEDNCKRRKWEKKCKREHMKHQNLSPEVRQQIHQLKLQIISQRPALCQLRLAKKQKKLELRNCLQTGCGDKESIWQEILDLKVKIGQVKSQIQPLRQSVQNLKASCKQQ
jgi:hypothetical protein